MKGRIRRLSGRMRPRRSLRLLTLGAVVVVAVGTSTTVMGSPAMANCAQRSFAFHGNQAQVNNCPGNGADSWAWVWNGSRSNDYASLQLEFDNGQKERLVTGSGYSAASNSYWKTGDIWRAKICYSWGQRVVCDSWVYV
ncbi:hypothetical protein GCM10022255_115140 [Dactylosporangium darangshiense]|uniref:Secreted protein n=1 Tax=Dactylosporangium darangshiense TaxID=579108 RepID=A0ABP8DVX5_9ACTN